MDYVEFNEQMNTSYYRADCYHTMKDPDNDATSGNHSVINATYHLVSSKLGGYTDPVNLSRDFVKQLRFTRSIEASELGLYYRHPSKKDQPQTHDDYIGLVVSSKLLPPLLTANYVVAHGGHHNWYFNVIGGSWRFDAWHGRFPGLVGVYKRAAGKEISWLDRIGYVGSLLADVYLSKDRTATSGKILIWLQNSVMRGESRMVDWAIDKWEEYIKKTYPGQIGEVLGIYHNAEHPFSKAMWGKI